MYRVIVLLFALLFCFCGCVQTQMAGPVVQEPAPEPSTPHVHTFSDVWSTSDTHHWHMADCGHNVEKGDRAKHAWNTGAVTAATCTAEGFAEYACTVCGATRIADQTQMTAHRFSGGLCADCGVEIPYTRINGMGQEDANGNYLLYGSYPQSKVTDTALQGRLTALAGANPTPAAPGAWTAYDYYINSKAENYMWWQDVELEGERYRGVYFIKYRPYSDNSSATASNSYQPDNGYALNTVYWFRYEPIRWRILEEQDGKAMLLCDSILDDRPYHTHANDAQANRYSTSGIRAWLNDVFSDTAFTAPDKQLMLAVTVDNSAAMDGIVSNPYACADTKDRVFLLSYEEATNAAYDFDAAREDDVARTKGISDYALCQGTFPEESSMWLLRTPDYHENVSVCMVSAWYGDISRHFVMTHYGIAPAMWIDLKA